MLQNEHDDITTHRLWVRSPEGVVYDVRVAGKPALRPRTRKALESLLLTVVDKHRRESRSRMEAMFGVGEETT